MNCSHRHTYIDKEPWPTGEDIEICKECGMSRAHWEQGVSHWQEVDMKKARKDLEEAMKL